MEAKQTEGSDIQQTISPDRPLPTPRERLHQNIERLQALSDQLFWDQLMQAELLTTIELVGFKVQHLARQIPGLASIAPRAEYNFRAGQHELLLCFSQLTEAEVSAVRGRDAEFGLFIYGLVIFFFPLRKGESTGVMRRIRGIWCQPTSENCHRSRRRTRRARFFR
jgi:hypothetical protein